MCPASSDCPLVLNVDDHEANRSVLSNILRKADFRVAEATTGRQALSAAAAQPDLILLDVDLPDVSGFDVCRRLKADPTTAKIPVLQLSARFTTTEDRLSALEGGADGYLTAPVEPAELVYYVRALVQARRAEAAREQVLAELQASVQKHATDLEAARRTVRTQLEQLQQAQKMEAIGRLAGGVAHDFNNLLTIINGYAELLLNSLNGNETAGNMIQEIRKAGDRAAGLTQQLLAFSRRQVLAPRMLDLNGMVEELEKMLRRTIGEDIELVTRLEPGLWSVTADPIQIDQVLLNLAVNARDAMPQGGRLTVETRNLTCAADDGLVPAGAYVLLAVGDTGHGMNDEVKARIFEPFFTTKDFGKGTGLGLATVFGVVRQSGGHVRVMSELGAGTTFQILLPRATEPTPARGSTLDRAVPLGGRGETVLIVEDEAGVRALTRLVLQQQGYHVLEARNGPEALNIARDHRGPVHLLATDVVMPEMGGRQVAEALQALQPGLRTLYLSGYTDDAVMRHGISRAEVHFLQKPFHPETLARKVREVLDTPL